MFPRKPLRLFSTFLHCSETSLIEIVVGSEGSCGFVCIILHYSNLQHQLEIHSHWTGKELELTLRG